MIGFIWILQNTFSRLDQRETHWSLHCTVYPWPCIIGETERTIQFDKKDRTCDEQPLPLPIVARLSCYTCGVSNDTYRIHQIYVGHFVPPMFDHCRVVHEAD